MEKAINQSLFEQIVYQLLLYLYKSKRVSDEEKILKITRTGEEYGRKAMFCLSKYLPCNHYGHVSKVLYYLYNDFWGYVYGNIPTDVTSPNIKSISFKDNNLSLLKRLDNGDQDGLKDDFIKFTLNFIKGTLKGVLDYFKITSEINVIFQHESFFVNINCE